jgi:hypothetical protein
VWPPTEAFCVGCTLKSLRCCYTRSIAQVPDTSLLERFLDAEDLVMGRCRSAATCTAHQIPCGHRWELGALSKSHRCYTCLCPAGA